MDTDQAIIAYEGTGSDGFAAAITVSTTTPTIGTPAEFETGNTNWIDVCKHNTTKFVITYEDDGDSDKGKSCYCSVNFGTRTVTPGTPDEFAAAATQYTACVFSDTDKLVIAFQDDADSDNGKTIIGDYGEPADENTAYTWAGDNIIGGW